MYMTFPLTKSDVTSLSEILNYNDSVNWVLGASKTGKTTFLSKLILSIPKDKKVFLLDTSGKFVENELSTFDSVELLPPTAHLSEETLEKLPPKSFVIVDDFQLLTKVDKWQRVVNYCAHHFHLSIFLVVHSHHNTEGLHTTLKNATNLYLTYSSNSKHFLSSLSKGKYLSFFNSNWKEGVGGHHICYVNTIHSIIVNFIDLLLLNHSPNPVKAAEMSDSVDKNSIGGIEEERWLVTNLSSKGNNTLHQNSNLVLGQDLETFFENELRLTYTNKKQFARMFKITRCLLAKGVLDSDQLILGKVSWMDFLAFTQRFAQKQISDFMSDSSSNSGSEKNNTHMVTFGFPEKNSIIKRKKTKQRKKEDKKWRKLCLKLKDRGVVIPITMIKNPVAKEYFS